MLRPQLETGEISPDVVRTSHFGGFGEEDEDEGEGDRVILGAPRYVAFSHADT